jgi:hypothetical protein
MIYVIFGGATWLLGMRILDPKYRAFGIFMIAFFFMMSIFIWLEGSGSTGFSGVWTKEFGFFLIWMLGVGAVGLLLGILMRFPRVHDVRAD